MKPVYMLIMFCVSVIMMLGGCTQSPSTVEFFCIVVLPDAQTYPSLAPEVFDSQMKWIRDNRTKRNIICTVFEGDITNENLPCQWEIARKSVDIIDGQVPFCIVTGNHDGLRDTTLVNKYFPVEKYKALSWFGGSYQGRIENCYYNFTSGSIDLLVLCLEFGPRDEVLKWANDVVARHPKRQVVVVTHAYVYTDNTRVGKGAPANPHNYISGDTNDGDEIWEKFVRCHKNICVVLSGHIIDGGGVGRITSKGDNGNNVHQMLANYQEIIPLQNGYLRILKFIPAESRIEVRTYSTMLEIYKDDPANKFDLSWSPSKR